MKNFLTGTACLSKAGTCKQEFSEKQAPYIGSGDPRLEDPFLVLKVVSSGQFSQTKWGIISEQSGLRDASDQRRQGHHAT
jgi:hypothetical protein